AQVGGIVGSWIITPAISGFIAYFIFMSAQKLIFDTDHPVSNAKKYVPMYMALAGFVLAVVTIKKGLKHVVGDLNLTNVEIYGYALMVGIGVAIIGMTFVRRVKIEPNADKEMHFTNVERIFAVLMVVTACCMAFAHGSNDVANAIGPLAAVVSIVINDGEIAAKSTLAWWILPLGGLGIVAGLALFGSRVMSTIGKGITHLTPSRGFAAELAAASTVVIASGTGLPISTTQTLVGAVLGVGMARGIAALNLGVIKTIVISWVITLPIGAFLAVIFFFMLRLLLL
ncbi:MAG: inorganic phosphate transporter, partial [Kangiellaceae bacterium]|nr:inorganic phosphate transporter [Kangiellaceae bacterium]